MKNIIKESWKIIAPFWPLKNLIAVNPLQGLEDLSFEDALKHGEKYFEIKEIPKSLEDVNRENIKWLQVFFDESQATIPMPMREKGFYKSWRKLAEFDIKLKGIKNLPNSSEETIATCLELLEIKKEDQQSFLTILLSTLSGWASYVKYLTDYSSHAYPVSQEDFLAIRIAITYLLWPGAKELLEWHKSIKENREILQDIEYNENKYRSSLIAKLNKQLTSNIKETKKADAQFVFCIDVRSEPFRLALEKVGNYETFGFAGFFGIPVEIKNQISEETYASCPVLLKPQHIVNEHPNFPRKEYNKNLIKTNSKLFYQSLKYNFTTTFALVETLGVFSGAWMFLRSFMPQFANRMNQLVRADSNYSPSLDNINFLDKCVYAESALKMIGLTKNFSDLVVLCGHGSSTENNAFATSLDCGACGGRHGASNARILADILNEVNVRKMLVTKQIIIPEQTVFIAAEHNTTNDEVTLYNCKNKNLLSKIQKDLKQAKDINSRIRCSKMSAKPSSKKTKIRSIDWSEARPEWGLARNAAFIVGPRSLTENIDLEGRCFLHSYDYTQDIEGSSLSVILTAPMVVAQWINAQYLFSSLNNVAYGAGSKITKNITGKFGIMQGNASDLMTGLPIQSVYLSDTESYHEMQRLMTVVLAPRKMIDKIVTEQDVLKKLFGNGWVTLSCIDPEDKKIYFLTRDLTWKEAA